MEFALHDCRLSLLLLRAVMSMYDGAMTTELILSGHKG